MRKKDQLVSRAAQSAYYVRLRSVTGADKVRLMSAMHEQGRRMVRASIRNRHPELSEEQVEAEARRRYLAWSK
jgi:hypothetical protein